MDGTTPHDGAAPGDQGRRASPDQLVHEIGLFVRSLQGGSSLSDHAPIVDAEATDISRVRVRQLVTFVEDRFDLLVPQRDIRREHFGTIAGVAAYVADELLRVG